MERAFFLSLILLINASCGHDRALLRELNMIETFVHERPDSALTLLSSMDTIGLRSDRVDAQYTLLQSIAYYRLYIEDFSEKDLDRAARYFRNHYDEARLMKTLFLQGYIQFGHMELDRAILTLTEAEVLADRQGDHYYGGLICRQQAEIFKISHENIERLAFSQKAYDHFIEIADDLHARYALLMVGNAQGYLGYEKDSRETFSKVIQISQESRDTLLWGQALVDSAEYMLESSDPEPEKALENILFAKDSLHYQMTVYSWSNAALAFAFLNNKASSKAFLSMAEDSANSDYELFFLNYRKYEIGTLLHKERESLEAARYSFNYLMRTQPEYNRQSVVNLQRDYFQEKEKVALLNHFLLRQKLIIVILLATGMGILGFLVFRRLWKRKRFLQKANEDLEEQMKNMETSHSRALKSSLKSGMRFFNRLAEFKWQNQPEKVLPGLEKMLNNLATDEKTVHEMMDTLNQTRGNLMVRLAEQVPTLKKDDLMIYCYLAHRFDHTTLCTILNRTPGALNAKIFRIRGKIERSQATDVIEFMDAISS